MKITHILKDGKVLNDIKGHVVKMDDAVGAYTVISKLNQKEVKNVNNI